MQWLWYERGDWDCHDRRKVLETLFERQREGIVTGLKAVVAVDERVFVEVTGPRLEEWGLPSGQACMVVTVRDGRIVRMQDYPNRAAALAGAGLHPSRTTVGEPQDELTGDPPRLRPDSPLAQKVTAVIRSGTVAELEQLLREHPALPHARLGDERGQSRTLLHIVTDWPGNVPESAAKIRALVAAGADVDARFTGPHTETPLHWAASSDDVEALDALLDAGADIEAEGAVIAGGTPIADAVAFGQWKAARRLLERGARINLWQAAALGLVDRVQKNSTARRRQRRTSSTTRCGAPRTAASAPRPSCCSTAAPTRDGSDTTGSRPRRPPSAAAHASLQSGSALRPETGRRPRRRCDVRPSSGRRSGQSRACQRTPGADTRVSPSGVTGTPREPRWRTHRALPRRRSGRPCRPR